MKRILLAGIRLYKRWLSPLLLPACRYIPTCSEYAAEAVEFHGPAKGALLAAWRLLRCHPLARGGFDPVPAPHCHSPHGAAHAHVADAYVAHVSSRVRRENQSLRLPCAPADPQHMHPVGMPDNSPVLQCRVGNDVGWSPVGTTEHYDRNNI